MNTPFNPDRRNFIAASAALAAGAAIGARPSIARTYARNERIRLGLIGCGGRGTGAAVDSLTASSDVQLVSLGDVFRERIVSSMQQFQGLESPLRERVSVGAANCFVGFDAYQGVIDSGVDMVLLTTPPHFRPIHLAAAVAAGKHVFMEKPVAVDGPGVRSVIASGATATEKKLAIVTGTQRRHEKCYLEAMQRVQAGALGKIVGARCYWNQGGLWVNARQPEWSDMEWMLRNWLYFTWLSGDHITEQHVHNLDVVNWALGATPLKASGMGGRQVRTGPEYGHVFDHFAVEYEYPGGLVAQSQCRQIDGCAGRVEEVIQGTEGTLVSASGRARIEGKNPWRFEGENGNPYVHEHADLVASIRAGTPLNEAKRIAESTLTAIMGRMATYSGKVVTWDQALNSQQSLAPAKYEFGPIATPAIPMPGRTPLA